MKQCTKCTPCPWGDLRYLNAKASSKAIKGGNLFTDICNVDCLKDDDNENDIVSSAKKFTSGGSKYFVQSCSYSQWSNV